ncbi:YihY/virulence factor BrkB family protein [Limoniibacter endophyticus]|uniref:YihY/virulence factor BrkB family protein n=1 Tax=Limoniibacter endophyticus TaxID=1565040 RepID=A0A8J3DKB1_9HYPH|nr:YihY/virulence factor BrkB family protein [Limoniibacter endophyticus]GHC76242.1 hypothetical protein GCM10010136_26760 [Limoniibacter endophyticus]
MKFLSKAVRIGWNAIMHFNTDDGWAMASHVAISALMALFPFLIFATTLASFLGASSFADDAVHVVFDTWPEQIAAPIASEVLNVLTVPRTDLLTFSVLASAFFASNGVEALRTSLNRAYRVTETRSMLFLRGQSLVFVLIATFGLLAVSVLLLLAPLIARFLLSRFEELQPLMGAINFWRYVIAGLVMVFGLLAIHVWLPNGKRRFVELLPGIIFTLIAWLIGSIVFAAYLEGFANYVSTYAGLASIMVAIVFLYVMSAIFILGGEINAACKRHRDRLIPRVPT